MLLFPQVFAHNGFFRSKAKEKAVDTLCTCGSNEESTFSFSTCWKRLLLMFFCAVYPFADNDKGVIGFLSVLIILTSVALLFVFYKLYVLKRQKSRWGWNISLIFVALNCSRCSRWTCSYRCSPLFFTVTWVKTQSLFTKQVSRPRQPRTRRTYWSDLLRLDSSGGSLVSGAHIHLPTQSNPHAQVTTWRSQSIFSHRGTISSYPAVETTDPWSPSFSPTSVGTVVAVSQEWYCEDSQ